jgi:hypothetical protein
MLFRGSPDGCEDGTVLFVFFVLMLEPPFSELNVRLFGSSLKRFDTENEFELKLFWHEVQNPVLPRISEPTRSEFFYFFRNDLSRGNFMREIECAHFRTLKMLP